jgi:two-component sensor histidine kinase
MSLAVHELATNAIKYGALSNSHGTVHISWTTEKDGLNFKWQEAGGPPVALPSRRGFGTTLLLATFSGIKLDYQPTGLTCEIKLPIGTAAAVGAVSEVAKNWFSESVLLRSFIFRRGP